MRVVAFRHVAFEHLGTIAEALARHGIECVYLDLHEDPHAAVDLSGARGLILMGGPMSANDELAYLRREMRAISEAMARGLPVLGICLGAQLIAKALGARIYANPVKEIGWAPVDWTETGCRDRLLSGLGSPEMLFHWHGETFDLPPGAEWLAWSGACRHQAFRVGSRVYGLQFHLEVTPEMIADWCRQDANCGDVRELEAPLDPYQHAARLSEIAATVFDRWCALLAPSDQDKSSSVMCSSST